MKVFIFTLILILFVLAQPSYADELVISGNGSDSESQISITSTSETNVTQTNEANIDNNVNLDANTGGNSASGNNGDVEITTGDINSQTTIENSANTSNVSLSCCPDSNLTVEISGNGEDSQNSVDLDQTSDTQINVNQSANIKNSINGSANTGGNSANDNSGGNVSITTGNINVTDEIRNENINLTKISAPQGDGSITIKIWGNGSDSQNAVIVNWDNNLNIDVNNNADIFNSLVWYLNTGENSASGNNGDVSISTGDINYYAEIINGPINLVDIDIPCCVEDGGGPGDGDGDENEDGDGDGDGGGDGDNPPPPSSPSNPPSNGGGGNGGQAQGAAIAAVGQILPATGSLWLILLTLIAMLMFILGLYLRLHPGRDPNLKMR
ncbi:hypothetical protein HYS94_05065 [Candidatus Daviesbacteria bacterium]|nr:hypothetical protein [Candidatus Daviesbacteria bacterium]